jgi:hypothetical protein
MIDSYDRQARYPEKHNAMKEFATLKYSEDKGQQAQWLKQQAEKLMEQGETAEPITLYRLMIKEYSDTESVQRTCFQLAPVIENDANNRDKILQTIKTYQNALKKYSNNHLLDYAYEIFVPEHYQQMNSDNDLIEELTVVLQRHSGIKNYEGAFFLLIVLYLKNKHFINAEKTIDDYLLKYPTGIFSPAVKIFKFKINKY